MKTMNKFLAVVSAVFLLTACETTPGANGSADGSGGANGMGGGANSTMGELAQGVGDRVFFDYDSAQVTSEGQETLRSQADWLNKNASVNVTIEGHCDERGTREYNLALGERRASSAKRFLTSLGVASSRISTISYGKERPAVIGDDESAYGQNRRAVTVLAQ